jgi:uncharacterized protein YjbI with pentapeptide repeats
MMRLSVRLLCAIFGLACIAALVAVPPALGQVAGQNVNMVSGTKWPTGDPFLQRQNEPSMAVSTRNPMHILAGANDYRSVDLETVLSGGVETGDAWLGLFKSFDGGFTWQSNLLPGCPYAIGQCKDSGALSGRYQAAADPVVRAGTNGMFYFAGLAFDRATSANSASTVSTIFVARYNDLNNNEQIDPITYIDTHIVATGNSTQFLDKPAMAVDIPREGAATCSFTANEPGVGPNGGTLAVHQSFAAGNIYLAYTDFLSGTKANNTQTHLMFTHSTDCGVTWSTPIQINAGTTTSQGSAIAVNPITGAVYVAWRQFASTGVSDAIMVTQSTNAGRSFSKPVQISTFQPFDQGTTGTSFRTNAYPTITTDFFGFVYVAFSARGLSSSGDARIVAAGSIDGAHWTPAIMVDNPPQNAQTNPSGRGHQIMPAMTFANGRLTILYYDLRLDHYAGFYTPSASNDGTYAEALDPEGELASPAAPSKVFTPYIDDAGLTLRRHTLDLRVLELGIFPTVTLGPSVLVSQYEYGCCVNPEAPDIEQFKFNVPNLPLFDQGQEAFLGDYIDVVPSPMFVAHGNSWTYNFTPSVNPIFHATWTDNRDVVPPPPGGSWEKYTAPVVAGALSVENGTALPACVAGQEGMRNQNIYTAQITGGLVVGAPGNSKPFGTTTFNGKTVPFQRAFPVEAQNSTNQPLDVRFTIVNQPAGGAASFLQFSVLTTLDVAIPPHSSVSRSVFATSTNAAASITVNVAQISAVGGSVVNNGLSSSAVLNPDITNPNITNPNITNPNITNAEVTNPNITNPNITNPNITNLSTQNPNITNPNITNTAFLNPNITNPNITNLNVTNISATNPNITNPNITNPNITNPNITNPNITNPNITNPDITNGSIQDVIYPITNTGNTTASYTVKAAANGAVPSGIVLQLIINKLYQTPVAVNCQLGVQTHWITVANITSPKVFTVADPNITNPDITNATPNEASVTLAPGETAYITLRVVNPTPALTPFNPLTVITPVTVPQAVNTTTVLANPGNPNLTAPPVYPPLTVLTTALPATDQADPTYSFQLQAAGGKPGADTWSITGGALPNGMSLSNSGLITGQTAALGPNSVTVQVKDGAGNTASMSLSVPVNPVFQKNTIGSINDGVAGQPYIAVPFTTTGGTAPITWAATGLPPGLGINSSTGQITGTPTVVNVTGYPVQVTATDSALPPNAQAASLTIRVASTIAIAPTTLPGGTIGTPYSVQLSATGGIGSYAFGPPSPATGVLLSSAGVLTIANPQASTLTFGVNVHDAANPFQVQNANYTISFAAPAIGNVIFVSQPPNYVGGQTSPNSPVHIHVQDSQGAPIAGAQVTMSLNGTPPCATATLSGTLSQQTGSTGDVFFLDLSVDRGQIGYTLRATVSGVFAVSNPFTVNGFCPSGNLSTTRELGAQVLLNSGKVLIAGGIDTNNVLLNTAEIYDPATGTVSPTGNLTDPNGRGLMASVLLADGRVLLVGGSSSNGNVATAEIYDPVSGTFSATGSMAQVRAYPTAVLLADGRVLVSGGFSASVALSSAEIYDPGTGLFTATGSLNQGRGRNTITLLPNGKVLVAGGRNAQGSVFATLASAEIFDPLANSGVGAFTLTGNMNSARDVATATLLSNGTVLLAGGFTGGNPGPAVSSADIFDPATGVFTPTGSMSAARGRHTATLLPDGTALVAGGIDATNGTVAVPTAEAYSPATGTFSATGSMSAARELHQATLLNNGFALVAGGDDGVNVLATTEVYYGTAPLAALQITTPPAGQAGTSVFSNPTAFNGAATNISPVGFNNILPAGTPFQGFNPLVVSGLSFSTSNPATTVNVTTSGFYAPNNYPADFIIDSSNPGPNNQLTIILPQPTRALALDYGGFAGGTSGSLTLSNGFVLPLSNLPGVGHTQFSGFVSATPFSSLTFNTTNDSWVVQDVLLATANTALPSATLGVPYTQVLLERGGVGPLTWTLASGTLPTGISLSPGGILTGTPTASGTFTFAVNLVDSSAPQKTTVASFTLQVSQSLTITTTSLPNGVVGAPYNNPIVTTGGTLPVSFSLATTSFPPGLTITQPAPGTQTGALAGTPTTAGTYSFSETVVDHSNPQQTATQNYTITIVAVFAGTTPNTLPTGTANAAYSQTLSSTGGVAPFGYQFVAGTPVPPGLSISPASSITATLGGTPTSAGTFTFEIQASDNSAPPQSYTEFLTVNFRPQPPTGLISSHVSGTTVVNIGWNPSISSGVSSYNVYRGIMSGGPYTLIGSGITTTNFTDGNAAPGTTVFYVVTAVAPGSPANLESAFSAELAVVVN